ncbi:MAG: hypothetical protein NTW99_14955 [Chloroflexi bacterium]|nr:hypothetical protein [Chloroflexota bacterium]
MKVFSRYSLIIALVFSLVACTAKPSTLPTTETLSDDQLALHVLVDFLENLHAGKYDEAAPLYGGTYEIMIDHNPSIPPDDYVALLRNACTINGAECRLQVKSAGLDKKVSNTEFLFKVDFLNADGALFVLGPCCGGNETESPPQSVFYFTVVEVDKDKFVVMDMPPYTP